MSFWKLICRRVLKMNVFFRLLDTKRSSIVFCSWCCWTTSRVRAQCSSWRMPTSRMYIGIKKLKLLCSSMDHPSRNLTKQSRSLEESFRSSSLLQRRHQKHTRPTELKLWLFLSKRWCFADGTSTCKRSWKDVKLNISSTHCEIHVLR